MLLQPIVPEFADKALTRLGLTKDERNLDTAKFGGGPSLKLYGRNLGENPGNLIDRIEREPTNGNGTGYDSNTVGSKRASG